VSVAKRPPQDEPEFEPRTLGDLLYANQAKPRVCETDWVNLVRATGGGDEVALHALYERTHRLVFTLALRITNSRETAEEVTIDVFHEVWRRASAYDAESGSVVGWIMNLARSRAIDRLRFEQRKKRVQPDGQVSLGPTEAIDPQQAFQIEEQRRLLKAALCVLTREEREAIETAFFSEMTYREVAAQLNQPLGTVKTRIRSGLGKLRESLATGSEEQ